MTYTISRGRRNGEPFDLKGLCEFTRELHLDAVDWVTTYGHDPHDVRRIMDDYGLKTICHTFSCDLNFPNAADRAAGRESFRKGIETAAVLGTDKVMLPLAGRAEFTREQSFQHIIAGLREVMGIADEAGVTVTVENFPDRHSPFIVSADVNRAVAEIPQLRITFDNGNAATGGENAYDSFKRVAPWVVHAHAKDFQICGETAPRAMRCLDGRFRRATLVGDGDVDQLGGLRAMKECCYTGYINFEYEGSEMTPRDATIEGVRRLREWIAAVQ